MKSLAGLEFPKCSCGPLDQQESLKSEMGGYFVFEMAFGSRP